MSKILFDTTYMGVVPSFEETQMHKHPMLHIFVGADKCYVQTTSEEYTSKIIIVDSYVPHLFKKN